nr:hypothetical protein Iba_chr04bCG13680 [Ipomoea batatas]
MSAFNRKERRRSGCVIGVGGEDEAVVGGGSGRHRMSPLIYGKKRLEEMVAAAPHRCFAGSGVGLARHHVASCLLVEKNRGDGCRRASPDLEKDLPVTIIVHCCGC